MVSNTGLFVKVCFEKLLLKIPIKTAAIIVRVCKYGIQLASSSNFVPVVKLSGDVMIVTQYIRKAPDGEWLMDGGLGKKR